MQFLRVLKAHVLADPLNVLFVRHGDSIVGQVLTGECTESSELDSLALGGGRIGIFSVVLSGPTRTAISPSMTLALNASLGAAAAVVVPMAAGLNTLQSVPWRILLLWGELALGSEGLPIPQEHPVV